MDREKPLTIEQAAERLNSPIDTLRYWRAIGRGPKSFRMGKRVFYMPADLDAWIEKCRAEATAPLA